jgi:hypothetical protein
MKMQLLKLVGSAAVLTAVMGLSGCVSYGNTHALLTPVGIAGYHTFKPANAPRNVPPDIQLQQDRDPNRIAAAKDEQKPAVGNDSET